MRHRVHPAGQARRCAGCDRAGNLAQRPIGYLRRPRHRRRCRDRRIPRPFPHHRWDLAAGGGQRSQTKIATRGSVMAMARLKSSGSGYHPELDDAERASRDETMALQTKRLAWSLKHAYENVGHYTRAFDAAGVHPSDFRQLSDLAKFPFTVKTDLRDNYPFNMFAVPREKLVRIHASSGTTGKPIVVGYTQADIDVWSSVMARSIRAAGGRTGMIIHNAYGYGLFTGGLGGHFGAERLRRTRVAG